MWPRTQFLTTRDPAEVEEALVAYLRKIKIEPVVDKTKFKIKFTRKEKHLFSNECSSVTETCVKIARVDDSKTLLK